MAGEWLKFEKATLDKPEVFAIASALGMDPDAVVGKLLRVWSWFDTHTTDGNGRGVTLALLDRISGVSGFASAMVDVSWLNADSAGVILPKFDRHTGETAKGRALTAKRVAKCKDSGNAKGNGAGVTPALPREEEEKKESKEDSQPPADSQATACPHTEIIALFHEVLPACTRVKVWDDTRQGLLRKRWREDAKRQSLDYWRRLFVHCSKSDFLMGRAVGSNGRPFQLSLDWIVKPSNFAKIIEGKYNNVR